MPDSDTVKPVRRYLRDRVRGTVDALEHLVGGLGTSILALGAFLLLFVVAVASVAGIGLVVLPSALKAVRSAADRERARLSRWGSDLPMAPPVPAGLRDALRDPWVRRESAFVATHGTAGFGLGLLGLSLPLYAVQYLMFPLYFRLLPPDAGGPGLVYWRIDGLADALAVGLLGVGWLAVVRSRSARGWPGCRPGPAGGCWRRRADVDLSLRVAELTATRAAALDAHAVELRRIERSLHDGTQNRLVAVTVLLGAARRALRA